MKRGYFIGLDTHCQNCEMAVVTSAGNLVARNRCRTTIDALREMLEAVPRPRHLVIEEGPLADWLYRNLHRQVESMTVSEPRRNRLIAHDGDKDDPLDAAKLAELFRGGYVKAVHHSGELVRTVFKQLLSLYHWEVKRRVAFGHRVSSLLKQHGVMARARHFNQAEDRPALLGQMPPNEMLRKMLNQLWSGYDAACEQEDLFRRQLVSTSQKDEVLRRLHDLPGIGWIRAATLYAYLDTPWRFKTRKALWKYLGIGLERRGSGSGPELLSVPTQMNRLLKSTILGAAKSAIRQGDNPFAEQHGRWLAAGLTAKMAQRNVARSLAATLWGLWKNGTAYEPSWVAMNVTATKRVQESLSADNAI